MASVNVFFHVPSLVSRLICGRLACGCLVLSTAYTLKALAEYCCPPRSAPRALLFWLPNAESCCLLDTLWPTTTATWLIIFALNALDSTPRTRHTPTLGPSTFFFRLVHNLLRLRSRTATTCAKRSLGSTMWHSYAHNASTVWFLALPHIFYGALLSGGHIKT